MGLWMYALGTGAAGKINQIFDEKRRLAGDIELERQKSVFDNTADPLADKFSIKDTDIMFDLPNYEKDLKGSTADRKRQLWMNAYYEGALNYNKDQWDAAKAANPSGYDNFKHKFLQEAGLFWKRYSQTEKGNTYREYDYSGLKDLLPDLHRDLSLLDPSSRPEENIKDNITEAFNVDDEATILNDMVPSDVIQVPFKFDTKNPDINRESFDNYYGKDFGKEVLMSSQYGMFDEEAYNMAKGESPWTILIPTFQWMSDNQRISQDKANKEIAQMQINYGLSDAELIDILVYGTKKHSMDSEGGFTTRRRINQVGTSEYGRAQNAAAIAPEIIDNIERLQSYVNDDDMAVGIPGGINRFYNSVMGSDETTMIDQFSKIINSVANADSSVMFTASGQGSKGDKNGLFSNDYYADTAEGVKGNILQKLREAESDAKEFYKRAAELGIDLTDPTNMDVDVGGMGNVRQSMIETLAIGLAFQIAMIEQGSGGKAVSDQDFDRAYQRVKGKWFSGKGDVIATLNEERFNMSKRLLRNQAMSTNKDYGMGVLKWYDRIADGRVKVLQEYKSAFNTIGMQPLEDRTQRLINMYTQTGGDQIVDFRYGVSPDVLDEEGMQSILANFTEDEARVLKIKLSDNNTLNDMSNNNKKIKVTNGEKVENDKFTDSTVGNKDNKIQQFYAPDLVHHYVKDGKSQGDTNIATIIDRVIEEISKDTDRVFFKNDEDNITFGELKDEDSKMELRMKILRQWMEKYHTQNRYDAMNQINTAFRNQVGMYGSDGIPEDQTLAVHNQLWGKN